MAKTSKHAAKKAVVTAVGRLTSASAKLKDSTRFDSIGLKGDLRKVLDASVLAQAHLDGIPLDGRTKKLKGDTVGELTESLSRVAAASPVRAPLAGYPISAIKTDVKLVMARIKHINPAEIKDTDKLKDWNFTRIDCRGLAQMLNLYYYNERGMVLTPWIHPSETDNPDMKVTDVAQVISSHNPSRRPGGTPAPV